MSIPACIWDYSNFNPEGPAHRNRQRFKLLLLAGHTLLKVATNAQTSGWHLWTVIIPRRSISGKLSFPDKSGDDAVARSGLPRNLSNAQIGTSQGRVRGTKRQSGDFTWSEHNEANRRRHGQTGIEQCRSGDPPLAAPAGDETQARRRLAATGLTDPRPRPAGRIPPG